MESTFNTQSLLPWLEPGFSKIHLEISLQSESLKVHGRSDPPFRILDSSSPLFRLIHASYRTPSAQLVKEVFLLVQKDRCSFTEKDTPFNNPEIDKVWQEALLRDGTADGLEAFDCLFGSSVNETSFPLWRSLFYCEKRRCYFHPPCPKCGNLLELCHRDEILAAAGLPLYTNTLERFLFCPVCHVDQTATDFFTHDGSSDAYPMRKSGRALVDGFEQLVTNGLAGENFPCQTCREHVDCYSSELAFSRIIPFAFYPFRMLVADAAQLPARDFVAMLSGASCAEPQKRRHMGGEPGKLACLESFQQQGAGKIQLFFENDTKSFLEILYLKIALLEQITRTALVANKHLKHPDLRLTVDQFWVDFPKVSGLLPLFWNFKVKPVALGIFLSEEIRFIRVPESFNLYSLALLWFNTLLVNNRQLPGDVQHALAILLDQENGFEDEPDFLSSTSISDCRVFGPDNIFWHPVEQQLPRFWLDLWQQALGLGWLLLQASFHSTDFSDSLFADRVIRLAGDVKKTLFDSKIESGQAPEPADSEILKILLSIQEKWKEDTVVAHEEGAAGVEQEAEEAESAAEKPELASPEADLEKTVILRVDQLAAIMENDDQPNEEDVAQEIRGETSDGDVEAEEHLEKTVIMNITDHGSMLPHDKVSAAAPDQQRATPPPKNVADDDLSETVIISQEELDKLRKGKNGKK